MKPFIITCLLTVAASVAASESDAPITPTAQNTWDHYKILSQRNIFSKDRGRGREERRTKDESTLEKEALPAPRPEAEILLIGIIQKDGVFQAFFENSKTGAVQTLRAGDSIARGKITTIGLDSIEYATDAGRSTVTLGTNLDGAIVAKTTITKSTASGDAGASDANAILERMRKKRQEEMRK